MVFFIDQEINKEQIWANLETEMRASFEENLMRMKAAVFEDPPPEKSENKEHIIKEQEKDFDIHATGSKSNRVR